jgi:hypothetical protein
VEAQAKGLCDNLERFACNARVKDREGLIEMAVANPPEIELKPT